MKTNIVSIILVFKNQRELAEQTLTAIYEHVKVPFDVFIVDDGSDDTTADALRSVIEHYAHDETYFYENPVSRGRALCIQDLITQCSAPVLWFPEGFTTIKGDALRVALEQLRNSQALFALPVDAELPENIAGWMKLTDPEYRLERSLLPDDNQLLVKLRGMNAAETFVNPYQDGWFGLEWLFRIIWDRAGSETERPALQPVDQICIRVSDFVHPIDDRLPSVARTASTEIATQLLRNGYTESIHFLAPLSKSRNVEPDEPQADVSAVEVPSAETDISRYTAAFIEYTDDEFQDPKDDLAADKHEDIVANSDEPISVPEAPASLETAQAPRPKAKTHVLSPFGKRSGNTLDAGTSPIAASLKPRLEMLFEEGEFPVALREISDAVKAHPEDIDLIRIQIIVLERMRRYVEAAELKHKLKNGLTEFKVRKEKILVVDPTEDTGVRAIHDDQGERFPSRPLQKTAAKAADIAAKQSSGELKDVVAVEANSAQSEASTPAQPDAPKPDVLPDEIPANANKVEPAHENLTKEQPSPITARTDKPETRFSAKPVSVSDPSRVRISYIIPTTGDGKHLLESALISLSRTSMLPDRELIVIDNASLDETYRYLNQLRKDQFMNIRVITNAENRGFAFSINQALDIARGEYVFVMHNDVQLGNDAAGLMADLMDIFDDIDAMGPVAGVSYNPDQRMHQPETDAESIRYSDYVDSFAMLIRRSNGIRFDEHFEAAYFEDVDFCQQIRNTGKRVAIARGIGVDHRGGATATAIGLEPNGRQYWKNLALFNDKWEVTPGLPFFGDEPSPVFQLITISEVINPFFPEKDMLSHALRLLTSETRHEIVQTRHARNDLYALIRLMMVLDIRDVLRQLEQQLDDHDLDDQLRFELIDFYYRKHIYSRGEKYLNELVQSRKTFEFRLLQLKILMGDKKLEEAAVLLNKLIDERPSHPELFKITADMHKLSGNREEASRFYIMAHQANPFAYSPRRDLQAG